ncbi:unnamed protein product [Spirodela intermedia]|uniref:Uncharacterized protein n=1 Tax=Spirodela intermedia TaxID=51605 RepID=A0A7I8K3W1_SPIIN|nr:unnamed protein product [Spirodela intermedia]
MMRARTTAPAFAPVKDKAFVSAGKAAAHPAGGSPQPEDVKWEVRPCGMLVQKRSPDSAAGPPAPTIRVRVKYGSAHHEIYLSSQATFGELKKLLAERTGLHPQDQKLLYKDKERESTAYLDTSGVKDRSKIVLVEDPTGQARRFLEMRKNAKMEKAAKSISQISLEVDKLATKVSTLESIASKGKKVAEGDVITLIEQLMNQLLKLDGLVVEGDVKLQRKTQVKRVQKYVETLDNLKVKNSNTRADVEMKPAQRETEKQPHLDHLHQPQPPRQQQRVSQPPVVVTTDWETFDLLSGPPPPPPSRAAPIQPAAVSGGAPAAVSPSPRLDWELF